MADDEHVPPRGYTTDDVATQAKPHKSFARRNRGKFILAGVVLVPLLLFVLWTVITLGFTYSSGERVGYIQKFSKKGWLCKTWEGEIAMATMPGVMPQIFSFSVRSDSIARVLETSEGRRVALHYQQHKGVPTTCFGETEYYIDQVRVIAQ
jgi:hypothetical protein